MIRQMFMRRDEEAAEIKPTVPLIVTLWLCAAAGILMGFFPQLILEGIGHVFSFTADFWSA
ncbi:hypothetical protein D3C73_1654030 [compost metagenome]